MAKTILTTAQLLRIAGGGSISYGALGSGNTPKSSSSPAHPYTRGCGSGCARG